MTYYLMTCGHRANALCNGEPACVICGCRTVEKEIQNDELLEGRTATCAECGKPTPSKWSLPFFEYRPHLEIDSYYCGCHGWD